MRIAAAESLPYLLECAKIRGQEYIVNMWQFICPELLKAVDTEPENDIKSEHMHALAQVGLQQKSPVALSNTTCAQYPLRDICFFAFLWWGKKNGKRERLCVWQTMDAMMIKHLPV